MSRNEIIGTIDTLLIDKFSIPTEVIMNNKSQSLVGETFRMDAIAFTYFFFEILRMFDIQINYEDLLDYKFITIEGIAELVDQQINYANK